MNASAPIAPGSPQRLPTRAAPSLVRALRDARGSPPWTPWTILYRLTGTSLFIPDPSSRARFSLVIGAANGGCIAPATANQEGKPISRKIRLDSAFARC